MAKNIPTVLIIFGATGDLMTKKIVPALFHLFQKKRLPKLLHIIGFSRRPLSQEEFSDHIASITRKHESENLNDNSLSRFINLFSYQRGDFNQAESYHELAKKLGRIDGEWKVCSNKLFYLATPPQYNESIFHNLSTSGLTIPCSPEEGWTRLIVEKPFGKDLKTAERLDFLLGRLFKEEQIYRIDHYLAKDMLQNILSFRFSNNLLEQSWNNQFIEKIEIKLLETLGVEDRGGFYDGLGALRDVGQNHLLQMLALVSMENPGSYDPQTVRLKRYQALRTLRDPSESDIKHSSFRAQYLGYKKIKGVDPSSTTETYFKLRTFLDTPRWQGVPIYLESGKRMREQRKEIILTFKHVTPCLCQPGHHFQNKIIFQIEPEEKIHIQFLSKKPGLKMKIEEKNLTFTYREKSQKAQYVEEYEKLLLDCIEGNLLLFVSTDEIRAMWNYIDSIINGWNRNLISLRFYQPGSDAVIEEASRVTYKIIPLSLKKEIGIVGLGKMGYNLTKRLLEKGWRVVGYNRTAEDTKNLEREGMIGTYSLKEFVEMLTPPRVVWFFLPAGKVVSEVLFGKDGIEQFMQKGDIVIDAGNSYYKDSIVRAEKLLSRNIHFVDVGFSGGPGGARLGACLMIGGIKKTYDLLFPLFVDVATQSGVQFFAGYGAGHFVKMIHNGIEYGMMQALAEGFTILKNARYRFDLAKVADVYNHGSVIESRLVGWLKDAFQLYGDALKDISGKVKYTGEGAWTVKTAEEVRVKVKIIEEALKFRIQSEKHPSYTGKVLTALRNQFGGHNIK